MHSFRNSRYRGKYLAIFKIIFLMSDIDFIIFNLYYNYVVVNMSEAVANSLKMFSHCNKDFTFFLNLL